MLEFNKAETFSLNSVRYLKQFQDPVYQRTAKIQFAEF